MIKIPREMFKTSMCTRGLALWTLAKNPDATIGIFNEKEENAQSWTAAIAEVVESSVLFQLLWRDMIPQGIGFWDKDRGVSRPRGLKWGATGLKFERPTIGIPELSIEPRGIGGAVTGKHYTHKILDDIIGEKTADSQALMQDAINWIDHSRPLERPAENGQEVVVHTPWAYADVYCWAPESRVWMADGSWKPISQVVIGDWVIGFEKCPVETKPHLVGKRGGAQSRTQLCFTRVVNFGSRIASVVTHSLNDGTFFRCTEEHKFFKIWKSGRVGSSYDKEEGLTDHNYSEVKNLTRLRKTIDPFDSCPDSYVAGWLGGMYDADGSWGKNRIAIYQSEKHNPDICQRIRDSLNQLGIPFGEYEISQDTNLGYSTLIHFCIDTREGRAKFLSWCKPTKHYEKLRKTLVGHNALHTVRIVGRSDPQPSQVHWIETETGNYICEGLASKNSHMVKKWAGEYKVYSRHLLEDENGQPDTVNGKSIFPQKISTQQAKKMCKTDPFVFWAQYMVIPKAGRTLDFADEWFRFGRLTYSGREPIFAIDKKYYDPEIYDHEAPVPVEGPPRLVPLSWMEKAVIFDPIPGKDSERKKETHCRHGLAVVGKDPWSRRFCLESERSDLNETDVCLQVLGLCEKWRADKIGIEAVNAFHLYGPLLTFVWDKYKDQFPQLEQLPDIIYLEPEGRQKDQRIRSDLGPAHQNGFWYYNREGTSEAIQELTEFPHSQFKDVSDAQSYTDKVCQRPSTPDEARSSWYNEKVSEQSRGLTGYGDFF